MPHLNLESASEYYTIALILCTILAANAEGLTNLFPSSPVAIAYKGSHGHKKKFLVAIKVKLNNNYS